MAEHALHWPTELRVMEGGRILRVSFEDGGQFAFTAELLRVKSPSAEVQGHSPAERKIVGGKAQVAIRSAQPVGNYAVKLGFDDGHDTGLFTWEYLHALGTTMDGVWSAYLADLAAHGLTRG